jgi:hypothetical protein
MYFHTDDPATLVWLANVTRKAAEENSSLRIKVNENGSIQVKRGGTWTFPIDSTFDFSRDETQKTQSCQKCDYLAVGKWDGAASVSHTCGMS